MRSPASFLFILSCFCGLVCLYGCRPAEKRLIHRGFYYWKSSYTLDEPEEKALTALKTEKLYIRFFDVEWNDATQNPSPVAPVHFAKAVPRPIQIVPVIFITSETLQKTGIQKADSLAGNIDHLLSSLFRQQNLPDPEEVQIDCDWNTGTRETYFQLLKQLRVSPFFRDKILSVTIRLHQLKFIAGNGIPPADKGLLMCYNMGNLKVPGTENSIIDPAVLRSYIRKLNSYPLPLDIALPLFDWWVWFRGNNYKGLLHSEEFTPTEKKSTRFVFKKDTVINGRFLSKGDWLRRETSPFSSILETGKLLGQRLQNRELNIVLYHLDSKNLSNYTNHELETIYNCFR